MTTSPTQRPTRLDAAVVFRWTLAITLLVKCVIALTVPITGDEAYFALWGRHLDYGYYDHGPMVGWWLWLLQLPGPSVFLVRLPAIIVTPAVALILRRLLRPIDMEKANLAATLLLLSPLNVIGVLTTTDTPLLFFSAIATALAYRAYHTDRWSDYLLAGLALGAAFLSKYFAVLLGLAFAVFFLLLPRKRPRVAGILLVFLGVLPAAAVNIAWNHQHGWTNILFNLFNRHEDSGFSLLRPLGFVAMTGYWLGPGVVYFLWRTRRERRGSMADWRRELRESGLIVFAVGSLVPAAVFFALSSVANVGFHWLISFYPFIFVVLFAWFGAETLRRNLRPMALYSGAQALIILVAVQLPIEWMRAHRSYASIVISADPRAVLAALAPQGEDFVLGSSSYAKAAMLAFFTGERVPVVGPGSFNGRHDDVLTDFRELDGRDIIIVSDRPAKLEPAKAWFREAELQTLEVRGARLPTLFGRGFNYAAYRENVLREIAADFYQYPAWFQPLVGPRPFLERYGFVDAAESPR